VKRMLGHASAAMTLDVYADLFDSDLSTVADKLDESVGKMWATRPTGTADILEKSPLTGPTAVIHLSPLSGSNRWPTYYKYVALPLS
jgi:hypothetical protein